MNDSKTSSTEGAKVQTLSARIEEIKDAAMEYVTVYHKDKHPLHEQIIGLCTALILAVEQRDSILQGETNLWKFESERMDKQILNALEKTT